MSNLSLIIFSLLVQASVGLYCISALWNFKNTGSRDISKIEYRSGLFAFALGFLGMIASFTHLGYPLNAINALRNIGSSWMSKEILLMIIYLISLALIILIRFRLLSSRLSVLFRNLAFLSAVLLSYSMIKVYSHPGLTSPDSTTVFISFISTTIFTGASVLVLLNIKEHEKSGNQLFLAGIAISVSFLNFLANPSINPHENQTFMLCVSTYSISLLTLIPALIPKLKNIYTISAVIFIILGIISEFINRFILLSFTSFSI